MKYFSLHRDPVKHTQFSFDCFFQRMFCSLLLPFSQKYPAVSECQRNDSLSTHVWFILAFKIMGRERLYPIPTLS
jgi:hypothetical protein